MPREAGHKSSLRSTSMWHTDREAQIHLGIGETVDVGRQTGASSLPAIESFCVDPAPQSNTENANLFEIEQDPFAESFNFGWHESDINTSNFDVLVEQSWIDRQDNEDVPQEKGASQSTSDQNAVVEQEELQSCPWPGPGEVTVDEEALTRLICADCFVSGRRAHPFNSLNDLDRHRREFHKMLLPGEPYWKCDTGCDSIEKVWTRFDNFCQHRRRVHEDIGKVDKFWFMQIWTGVDV